MKVYKKKDAMTIQTNELIKYFANTTIQYVDLFVTSLGANEHDHNRNTAPRLNGLVVTLSGSADFSLNGEVYALHKGVILHAGPTMEIDILVTSQEPWRYTVIHYEAMNGTNSIHKGHFEIDTGQHNKMDYLVQQLIHYEKIPGDINKLKCKSLFLQLLELIVVCAKMQTSNNVVDQAITFMTEHYTSQISIAEIAEEVGCDRRRLAYLFDKQTGMSPIQFLTEFRLKHAKELLRTTSIPIKDIAELVGYQDAFYFCRVFKKQYDQTPTNYRKQFFSD
ncbi:AraC family transcriptional regulator [Solibacillus ferritrahens]|uniref:Helix-turn-helix transcriptional regulator n=2 Tax=Solibacillus merdavium TaxID=2762218 RepID=A0ABR8XQ04_9BACL|nr:helix-turn-helix transcriptional regulator [Solibacillus merdavium]